MCVPCIVQIAGSRRRTWQPFIFAILPTVGEAFAFDEPGGIRCDVIVLAVELGAPDGPTLRVQRIAL